VDESSHAFRCHKACTRACNSNEWHTWYITWGRIVDHSDSESEIEGVREHSTIEGLQAQSTIEGVNDNTNNIELQKVIENTIETIGNTMPGHEPQELATEEPEATLMVHEPQEMALVPQERALVLKRWQCSMKISKHMTTSFTWGMERKLCS